MNLEWLGNNRADRIWYLLYTIYLRLSTVTELGIQITTRGNLEGNYLFFTPVCFMVYFGQDFIFNTPLILLGRIPRWVLNYWLIRLITLLDFIYCSLYFYGELTFSSCLCFGFWKAILTRFPSFNTDALVLSLCRWASSQSVSLSQSTLFWTPV